MKYLPNINGKRKGANQMRIYPHICIHKISCKETCSDTSTLSNNFSACFAPRSGPLVTCMRRSKTTVFLHTPPRVILRVVCSVDCSYSSRDEEQSMFSSTSPSALHSSKTPSHSPVTLPWHAITARALGL